MPSGSLRAKVSTILEGTTLDAVNRMEHSWEFNFGSVGLTTGFPWRIVSDGRLTLASGDDGHPFGLPQPIDAKSEAARALVGQQIVSVIVDPETADLRITFGGGARLEVLSGSIGLRGVATQHGGCVHRGRCPRPTVRSPLRETQPDDQWALGVTRRI